MKALHRTAIALAIVVVAGATATTAHEMRVCPPDAVIYELDDGGKVVIEHAVE
jgi:hypothetical protein